ncbi:hypothetical protein F4810DRAFT_656209, partial [Camillea tinctor]
MFGCIPELVLSITLLLSTYYASTIPQFVFYLAQAARISPPKWHCLETTTKAQVGDLLQYNTVALAQSNMCFCPLSSPLEHLNLVHRALLVEVPIGLGDAMLPAGSVHAHGGYSARTFSTSLGFSL